MICEGTIITLRQPLFGQPDWRIIECASRGRSLDYGYLIGDMDGCAAAQLRLHFSYRDGWLIRHHRGHVRNKLSEITINDIAVQLTGLHNKHKQASWLRLSWGKLPATKHPTYQNFLTHKPTKSGCSPYEVISLIAQWAMTVEDLKMDIGAGLLFDLYRDRTRYATAEFKSGAWHLTLFDQSPRAEASYQLPPRERLIVVQPADLLNTIIEVTRPTTELIGHPIKNISSWSTVRVPQIHARDPRWA